MTLYRGILRVVLCAIPVLLTATAARADFITGYGWVTTETITFSASATSLADPTCSVNAGAACTHANADVTFTTTGVDFGLSGATIANWLATSVFPLNGLVDNVPGSLMDPTIWEFVGNISVTGTVATPQSFTIAHDDGVTFVVNGQTVINAPGPTAPVTTSANYTGGAGGSVPFSLIYSECCGGPAVLRTSLLGPASAPAAVPEPGSIVLLGTALLVGIGAIRRKSHKVA